MSPTSEAVSELRLLVTHAEDTSPGQQATHADLQDYRTGVVGDLLELLDQLDRGLGTRLMLAMYPHTDAMARLS